MIGVLSRYQVGIFPRWVLFLGTPQGQLIVHDPAGRLDQGSTYRNLPFALEEAVHQAFWRIAGPEEWL